MPVNDPQPGETWTPAEGSNYEVLEVYNDSENEQRLIRVRYPSGMEGVQDYDLFVETMFLVPPLPPPVVLSREIENTQRLLREQRERPVGADQADANITRMLQGVNQTLNEAFGPVGPERNARIREAVQRRTGQLAVERNAAQLREFELPPLTHEELRVVNLLSNTLEEMLTDEFEAPDRLRRVRAEIAQRLLLRSVVGEDPQKLEGDVPVSEGAPMKKYETPKTQWERLSQEDDDA